jgi:K+-sensing histidine kinase KdpD
VLVFVDGSPGSERAVRSAWRLAHALGGELIAAVSEKGLTEAEGDRLVTLAEDLNSQVKRLNAEDNLVDTLSLLVASENISHVVLAYRRHRWRPRLRPTLAEQLLDRHPSLSIHLVPSEARGEQ